MKTRKILLYFMALPMFMLGAVSCNMEDLGNYDYKTVDEVFPLTIGAYFDPITGDSINIRNFTLKSGDTLKIHPTLSDDNGGPYVYRWYVIADQIAGTMQEKWEVSSSEETPDLVMPVVYPVGRTYTLYFRVTDPKLNLFKQGSFRFTISESDIAGGWYIMKTSNGGTDFDYHKLVMNPVDSTNSWQTMPNILQTHGLDPMPGNPVMLRYQGGNYSNSTSERGQRVWHVLTTEGFNTYRSSDFHLFKDINAQFYANPAVVRPQIMHQFQRGNNNNPYFVNDGFVYSIYQMMANVGKYAPTLVETKPGIYTVKLVSGVIIGCGDSSADGGMMGFDSLSNSFVWHQAMGKILSGVTVYTGGTVDVDGYGNPIPDDDGNYTRQLLQNGRPYLVDSTQPELGFAKEPIAPDNIEMLLKFEKVTAIRMLKTGDLTTRVGTGYAIFQSNLDPSKHYLAKIATPGARQHYPFTSITEIPTGAKILDLDRLIAGHTNYIAIYFVGDDASKLYTYTPDGSTLAERELLVKEFPGETITWLEHTTANRLLVLTSTSSGGYKFYELRNDGSNPWFAADDPDNPILILEGVGTGGYAMSR